MTKIVEARQILRDCQNRHLGYLDWYQDTNPLLRYQVTIRLMRATDKAAGRLYKAAGGWPNR